MSIRSAQKHVQVKLEITRQFKVCLARAMHGVGGNTEEGCSDHVGSQGGGVGYRFWENSQPLELNFKEQIPSVMEEVGGRVFENMIAKAYSVW